MHFTLISMHIYFSSYGVLIIETCKKHDGNGMYVMLNNLTVKYREIEK